MISKKDQEFLKDTLSIEKKSAVDRVKKSLEPTFAQMLKSKRIKFKSYKDIKAVLLKAFGQSDFNNWSKSVYPENVFTVTAPRYFGFKDNYPPDENILQINKIYTQTRIEIMRGNLEEAVKGIESLKQIGINNGKNTNRSKDIKCFGHK